MAGCRLPTQPLAHPSAAWTGEKTAPGPHRRGGDQGFVIPSSEQDFIATSASPASLFVPPLLLPLHVAMLGGFQPWGCSPARDRVLGKKQGMGRGRLGVPPPSPQHSWEPEGRYRGGMVNPTDHFPPLQEGTEGDRSPWPPPGSSLSPTHTPWVPSPGGLHPEEPRAALLGTVMGRESWEGSKPPPSPRHSPPAPGSRGCPWEQ